jgi:KDO2-lipid IV(A) lauroyltransferase
VADKRFKHRLEYAFLKTVQFVANALPAAGAVAFGTPLGALAYAVWARRRNIALANLRFCFPDADERWVRRVARRSFENVAKTLIDYMRLGKLNAGNISRYHAVRNQKCYDDAYAWGRGAVVFTGHFGSWEQTGAGVRLRGYAIHYLVGEQTNRLVDDEMNRLRAGAGIGIIHMGAAAKGVFKVIRANGMVALLSDQDAGPDGVRVKFFGHDASTPKGPAAFVAKTGAAVCAGFTVRDSNTHNTLIMEDAYVEEATGDLEADIARITQRYTTLLEKYVRAYPDQYYWMHRRFKTTHPEIYRAAPGKTAA